MKQTAFVDIDMLLGKKVNRMYYIPSSDKVVIEIGAGFEIVLDGTYIRDKSPKPTTRTFDSYRWAIGCLNEKEV